VRWNSPAKEEVVMKRSAIDGRRYRCTLCSLRGDEGDRLERIIAVSVENDFNRDF